MDDLRARWWQGALAGLLAALVALAVAELVAGLIEGATSPVVAVGDVVIDNAPSAVKELAIRELGTNDKPALIAGTLVLLALSAAGIGVLALRWLWVGIVGVVAFGAAGVVTAVSRAGAPAGAWVPAVVGTLVAVGVLVLLVRGSLRPARPDHVARPPGFDRRRFLLSAAIISGAAVAAGGLGRMLQRRFEVSEARAALRLPPPASPGPPTPPGANLAVAGITPFTTPNGDFYRIDTALVVPQVTPDSWRLRIHGMVDHELELRFTDLVDRPLIERDITLVCVSNEVGGSLAGNARWLGVRLADLLAEAGVRPGADQLVSRSVDGYTAGTPTAVAIDGRDAMVAIGMNGEPLPITHGFPARLVVPGLYGYTSATKWLTELELTTFAAYDAYWVRRGWAAVAPIKTATRIDAPRGRGSITAGRVPVAGVAWAPHSGIEAVEVRVDDGPWQQARLGEVPGVDTWRQWVIDWEATPGTHSITARAVDGTGEAQTADRTPPIPDGASGWPTVVVTVT